jgi:hypothetical protein
LIEKSLKSNMQGYPGNMQMPTLVLPRDGIVQSKYRNKFPNGRGEMVCLPGRGKGQCP